MESEHQEYTSFSTPGGTEEADAIAKKSRKRKKEKKPLPLSSTLQGLWGKKSTDECSETPSQEINNEGGREEVEGVSEGVARQPLIFKFTPSKLAAALTLSRPAEAVTPPKSSLDVVPETPIQQHVQTPQTPASSGRKKRALDASPSEGVRRSPRNHRTGETQKASQPVKIKPHPFFLGKEARKYPLEILVE